MWGRCSGRGDDLAFLTCVLVLPQLGEVSCEEVPCPPACSDPSGPPGDCCSSCSGKRASASCRFSTVFLPFVLLPRNLELGKGWMCEVQAQRGNVSCLRSHSQHVARTSLFPGLAQPHPAFLMPHRDLCVVSLFLSLITSFPDLFCFFPFLKKIAI